MTVKNSPPGQAAVSTPYGLQTLVEASAKLASEHVLADVTEVVRQLADRDSSWETLLVHTGWVDPAGRIGLLDFSWDFPDKESLEGMKIRLVVWRIEGGNGEPLHMGEKIASATFNLERAGWGELVCSHSAAGTTEWNEWISEARTRFKAWWDKALADGQLQRLLNPLSRDQHANQLLRHFWCTDTVGDISRNLGLDLQLIDSEDEAERYTSSLEWQATQVHLVTPWLAAELEKRGAHATVRLNLPLWSRDTRDAAHLEPVMQDIAFERFGQSLKSELASTPEE